MGEHVRPHCKIHFASKQSVWNHKQRCKVGGEGAGFTFTPASNGVVATRKLDTVHEHLDENASSDTSENSKISSDDNESLAGIVDGDSENECEDKESYWYIVYR